MTRTITILGAGFVGVTTAALFANAGYKVYLVELNAERLDTIKQGRSFFYEEGLDPLIARAVSDNRLIPTNSYAVSVPQSQFVFSCVGTPDRIDGSSNLDYIYASAKEAIQHLRSGTIFAQKSTVPPGTGEKIEKIFADSGKDVAYVSNPEFLREAKAIEDTLFFDHVVVGGNDFEAVGQVLDVYRSVQANRDSLLLLAGLKKPSNTGAGKYFAVERADAELIKVAANAFLSLKITYSNFIAMLADQAGADAQNVLSIMGLDWRIGSAFLNPGRGFGGGCFPKDNSGLVDASVAFNVDSGLIETVLRLNSRMPGYVIESLRKHLGGSLAGKRVALLGLSFKAGTSDTRKSPAITLANLLYKSEASVIAFDPQASEEIRNEKELWAPIAIGTSLEEALEGADAVVIGTAWPEFRDFGLHEMMALMAGNTVYDADSCFKHLTTADIRKLWDQGTHYLAVGRSNIV